ncbi:MAG: hypothetical protein QG650_955 [Patescibacteria group bacterium]|nr:hypothetical protein [Patescibacteria group bacterium]
MFKFWWFVSFGGVMSGMIAIAQPQTGLLAFMAFCVGGLACYMLHMPSKNAEPPAVANEKREVSEGVSS